MRKSQRTANHILLCAAIFFFDQAVAVDAIQPGAVIPVEPITIPQPEPELIAIPPVIDRPLGEEEGPIILVKAFRINNPLVRPDLGITMENIQQIADDAIKQSVEDEQREGNFTIGQLQLVADQITNHYRQAGIILARAVVPSQDVKDNVVVIDILPGVLGSVAVEGNNSYSNEILSEPFEELLGKEVDKISAEGALLHLSDYPGAELFGVFRPGKREGETELLLKMQNEQSYTLDGQLSNYGSEYTGDYQARINAAWLNPTGAADQLSLSLLKSFSPSNNLYGSIAYQRPIFSHKNHIGLSYTKNAFDVGEELAAQNISGESQIANIYWLSRFLRSRLVNAEAMLGLSHKRSETLREETVLGEDQLSVLGAQLTFDYVDAFLNGGITQGALSVSRGLSDFLGSMDDNGDGMSSRVGGSGERGGGDFSKVNLSLVRLQQLSENHSLLLRLEGQYSSDLLVSLEQSSLGGPGNVRAYGPSEYLRDSSIFGSIEWIIKAPGFADKPAFSGRTWGEVLQVSLFYDAAKGWLNDPLGSEVRELDLSGLGIGIQLALAKALNTRLDVAFPTSGLEPGNERDPQYYFNIGYQY